MFNLAEVYVAEGKADDAEPLCDAALKIREKIWSEPHPRVAGSLQQLGQVREIQGKDAEAESLYKQSLAMYEKTYANDHHPEVVGLLKRYAALLNKMDRGSEAKKLLSRATDEKGSIASKAEATPLK